MWESLLSLNCGAFVKGYFAHLFFHPFHRSGFDTDFMVNNDEETGLISYIGKMFQQQKYQTVQERNTPKSSMTRVFTNGTFLWQTTQEYQPSPIPTFRLWLLVRRHLPSHHQDQNTGVSMVIPFEHHCIGFNIR